MSLTPSSSVPVVPLLGQRLDTSLDELLGYSKGLNLDSRLFFSTHSSSSTLSENLSSSPFSLDWVRRHESMCVIVKLVPSRYKTRHVISTNSAQVKFLIVLCIVVSQIWHSDSLSVTQFSYPFYKFLQSVYNTGKYYNFPTIFDVRSRYLTLLTYIQTL